MAEMSVIAHPYAQALFNLAKEQKTEEAWLENLSELKQISTNQDFVAILNNPKVDVDKIISIIKTLMKSNASVEVMNFVEVLVENNRILALDEIYHIFRELILEDQKRGDAIIESAYAMSQAEKQDFEQILSKKFGKKITAQVIVNPELIGGIKVTVNDKVIDGSVKGRINTLSTQLTK